MIENKNKIAVIIVSYNSFKETTKPCIESIYKAKTNIDFEVIVVDNFSTDGTREYLYSISNKYNNFRFILNDKNYGFAIGNNIGIKSIDADIYVLLNSDTIVCDRWLDKITKFFLNHPEVGLVGPVSNSVGNEQVIYTKARTPGKIIREGLKWTQKCKNNFFYSSMLGFFCVAISKKVIKDVGFLGETYGIGTFEDDDYCIRATQKGYKLACMEDVFIYHKGSFSFKLIEPKKMEHVFYENLKKFEDKFNIKWKSSYDVDKFVDLILYYLSYINKDNMLEIKEKIINKLHTMKNFDYAYKNLQVINLLKSNQEKDIQFNSMQEGIQQKDIQINTLNEELSRKDIQINTLNEELSRKAIQINTLNEELSLQINTLNEELSRKTMQINSMNEELSLKTIQINSMNEELSRKTIQINSMNEELSRKDIENKKLTETIENKDNQINKLDKVLCEKNIQIISISQKLSQKEIILNKLRDAFKDLDMNIEVARATKAWRLMCFLRRINQQILTGDIKEKKNFLDWIRTRISGRPVTRDIELTRFSPINVDFLKNIEINKPVVNNCENSTFSDYYQSRINYFKNFMEDCSCKKETTEIIEHIKRSKFNNIIIYPGAIRFEPIQRPQQFMYELGKRGYLCFFVDGGAKNFYIEEKSKNVFLIGQEGYLLPILKELNVIFLCTWVGQISFIDLFPRTRRFIWYDICDKLDFFTLYDNDYLNKHNELVVNADMVTYSGKLLKDYVKDRDDAVYLPNAVRVEDFFEYNNLTIPDDINDIVRQNKKIIGYYGAVEEWFDIDLVLKLAIRNPMWNFIIIGNVGIDISVDLPNIYFLGFKQYSELRRYANCFDVAFIPFVVNELTNCVSPVKFFEYISIGLPVVSTPITEMIQYQSEWVRIGYNAESFEEHIKEIFLLNIKEKVSKIKEEFLSPHQWSKRIMVFEELFQKSEKFELLFNKNTINFNYDNTLRIVFNKNNKLVDLLNINFFDWSGNELFKGGAERYITDLALLIKENFKHDVRIIQNSLSYFEKEYYGFKVIGIPATKEVDFFNFYRYYLEKFDWAEYVIASPMDIPCIPSNNKIIGINHGIHWDRIEYKCENYDFERVRYYFEALKNIQFGICVDTNFINWVRTFDYSLSSKLVYIPNYYDIQKFLYIDKRFSDEEIIILYPRRLYSPRGLYLLLELIDEILPSYNNVIFHLVGQAISPDKENIEKYLLKYPDKIKWYSLDMQEMPRAYKDSQIVIIPTLHSEGTSLSCIEAMATNNAIIATNIGGLPNLIVDNYNGLLINPDRRDLVKAVKYLIENRQERLRLAQNAYYVASTSFKKDDWDIKWIDILTKFLV